VGSLKRLRIRSELAVRRMPTAEMAIPDVYFFVIIVLLMKWSKMKTMMGHAFAIVYTIGAYRNFRVTAKIIPYAEIIKLRRVNSLKSLGSGKSVLTPFILAMK
jgi:hypothetical protein